MKHHLLLSIIQLIALASCGVTNSSLSTSSSSSLDLPTSTFAISSSEIKLDVIFDEVPFGLDPRQTLEIAYRPNDVIPSPIVLFIHGGSWIGGDRSMMRRYQDQVVDAGYTYVSMNYRFITNGLTYSGFNYLDLLDDIELVLRFLKENADFLNVDTSRMAMVGESAGAHLAMLYAYRNVSPIPIEFVMALVPPVDFTDPGYLTFGNPIIQLYIANGLLGTSLLGPEDIEDDVYPESWMDASPVYHLSKATPTLIGYAGLDELIPISNMNRFLIASTSINAPIEAILFPNSSHSLSSDPDKLNQLLSTFFVYLNNFLPITAEVIRINIDN